MRTKVVMQKTNLCSRALLGVSLVALIMVCFSCTDQHSHLPKDIPTGKKAYATLNSTEGNTVKGSVTFIALEKGVRVIANVEGMTPGNHGFHIHEFGDCSAPDASSAGGHYNPTDSIHAGPLDLPRHSGDLGNLTANKKGVAAYDYVDFALTLEGEQSIIGKSVIVHENKDDYISQPTGNAGPRQACGVIKEGEPD
jgi:superoxide dismutase, Cu-Zn family